MARGYGTQRIDLKLDITGVEDFQKNMDVLRDNIQKRVVLEGFRAGAELIRDRAVELSPGKKSNLTRSFNSVKKPTGFKTVSRKRHLFETIKVRRPKTKDLRENREIIFSVTVRHPLAFLAEYGSGLRRRIKSGGSTGVMPAFSFMRRAVDEKGQAAIDIIVKTCMDSLNKALRRNSTRK